MVAARRAHITPDTDCAHGRNPIDIAAADTRRGFPDMAHDHDHTVLVLQGGGALGAYQAGVYEGMLEQGFAPDWVTGVSIGAINGALIAGNPVERRLERLREFWDRVSSGLPWSPFADLAPLRAGMNRFSAAAAATLGVPGFFSPRIPPALFAPEALSVTTSCFGSSVPRVTPQNRPSSACSRAFTGLSR